MAAKLCRRLCPARAFLLQHERPSDFVHSVLCASPIPYAVTVTVLSAHTLAMALYSGVTSAYRSKILIWLTYWSYFSLTARFLLTTWNSWSYVLCQRRRKGRARSWLNPSSERQLEAESSGGSSTSGAASDVNIVPEKAAAINYSSYSVEEICEMPTLYKVQWVLQNVTSCSALIVTSLYWVVMYDPNKSESPRSINSHVLNSLVVLVDVLVSRAPVRVHHFVYTLVYILLYGLFSLVYWAAGGTNHQGQSYIYNLLNYSRSPGTAAAVVLGVALLGTLLTQTLLYLLFRLKQCVWGRCALRKGAVPPPPTSSPGGGVDGTVKVSTSSLGTRSENGSTSGHKRPGSRLEKDISLDDSSQDNLQDFGRGRDYTLPSNRDAGDTMIDVDMDFEMDEVNLTPTTTTTSSTTAGGFRPPIQTNSSQVSCTDSTKALLT